MTTETDFLTLVRDEGLHSLMLMACPDGIVVTNARGQIILIAGAAESLFGVAPVEVAGRDASVLFASDGGFSDFRQRLLTHGSVANWQLAGLHAERGAFPAAVSAAVLTDRLGERIATVMYVRDNSTLRSIEEALRDNNRQLNALVKELGHVARHDQLTGLLNRASAMQAAEEALLVAGGTAPFGVAIFDLDHFKRVNDSYGHLVGDEVLATLARVLASTVRTGDIVGRFGGEEFVAFLPGSPLSAVRAFAERVRGAIAGTPVSVGDELAIAVTVSAGIASIPGCADSLNEAIRVADDRLLQAKRQGRNQVVWNDGDRTRSAA
ncbi:MAG: hypothetical protein Kow0010_13290 [Dehalococcoidia bacterium]